LRFALLRNPTGIGGSSGNLHWATFAPPGGSGDPVTFFWTADEATRTVWLVHVIVGLVM
jgi:hypothetical protein